MRKDIQFSALKVTSDVNLSYVSRAELKSYAKQIIASQGLNRYYIDRQWTVPDLNDLSPPQKIVAYILLDLRLATVDKNYFNVVPEVSFFRRNQSVENGLQKVALDTACIGTFRTICPIDKSVVAQVCVEKCAEGGIYSLDMTTSLNDNQYASQRDLIVESISYAMKNLFEKLSPNSNSFHRQNKQK